MQADVFIRADICNIGFGSMIKKVSLKTLLLSSTMICADVGFAQELPTFGAIISGVGTFEYSGQQLQIDQTSPLLDMIERVFLNCFSNLGE